LFTSSAPPSLLLLIGSVSRCSSFVAVRFCLTGTASGWTEGDQGIDAVFILMASDPAQLL
ncbi:hypothetical protein PIB30_096302, partial [Stylosanthes scabra]|nr:hypothetical protein [Stylosanthes scabra]